MTSRSSIKSTEFSIYATLFLLAATAQGGFAEDLTKLSSHKDNPLDAKYLRDPDGLKTSKKLPRNFPIAIYSSNVTKKRFGHSTAGAPTAGVSIVTKDPPRRVYDWYRSTCQRSGWKFNAKTFDSSSQGSSGKKSAQKIYLINASKKKHNINIFCMKTPQGSDTTININWTFDRNQ